MNAETQSKHMPNIRVIVSGESNQNIWPDLHIKKERFINIVENKKSIP